MKSLEFLIRHMHTSCKPACICCEKNDEKYDISDPSISNSIMKIEEETSIESHHHKASNESYD